MPSSDPTGRHDWHSPAYVDEWIASSVTRDEQRRAVLQRVVQLIPHAADAAIRVLDIGAGYGALGEQVLRHFPHAELVCHDFSEPMFAEARERLAWAADRLTFVKGDLATSDWTRAVDGPFDAVVSAIAIHNVRHLDRIRGIYTEVYPLVAPGGCFVNADLVFPVGTAATQAYQRLAQYEAQRHGKDNQKPSPAQAHSHSGHAAQAVPRASLESQLRWLREAGFEDVECFWKEMRHAIIGGFR